MVPIFLYFIFNGPTRGETVLWKVSIEKHDYNWSENRRFKIFTNVVDESTAVLVVGDILKEFV